MLLSNDQQKLTAGAARRAFPVDVRDAGEVAVDRYVDEAYFAREQQRVFGRAWLMADRSDRIAGPGDYFVPDHPGPSLIFVRDQAGRARGFRNACRHRGCEVAQGCGNAKRLVCPYHGWAYDLNGSLQAVPQKEMFVDLDLDTHGLTPVRVEEWAGFIWYTLDAKAPELAEYLGPIHGSLDAYGLDAQSLFARRSWDVDVNWKLVIDNFNESYHNPFIHPKTSGPYVDWRAAIPELIGDHSRLLVPYRYEPEALPEFPQTRIERARAALDPALLKSIGGYNIFPNLMFWPLPGYGLAVQALPLGPTRTRFSMTYFGVPAGSPAEQATIDERLGFYEAVFREDFALLPAVQRGLRSGGLESQPLGYLERAVRHFHAVLDRYMR